VICLAIERLSWSRVHIVHGSGYTSSDVRAYALQVQALEGRAGHACEWQEAPEWAFSAPG
jgi:hypothetical protein